MLQQSRTREALTEALAQYLRTKAVPSDFSEEFSRELVQEFAIHEISSSPDGTLGALVGNFAIRKDDMNIFDAVTDGLKAAAGASFFLAHQPVLAANVGIALSIAKLLRSLTMRSALLDRDHLEVLTILKCKVASLTNPGLTAEELLTTLRVTRPDLNLEWLQQRLAFLGAVPTLDGSTTKLASADSSGRWRSHI